MSNCVVSGSNATDGSAALIVGRAYIEDCVFHDNVGSYGGALHFSGDTLNLVNSKFFNNNGKPWNGEPSEGGAIYSMGSLNIINSLFYNNSADIGGAFYFMDNSTPKMDRIINCTIANNPSDSGALYNKNPATYIYNSIFWNDTIPEIFNSGSNTAIVNYSLIGHGYSGTGNISSDPLFDSTYHLNSGSPAINSGYFDNSYSIVGITDLDGNPRIVGVGIDMGAYESQAVATFNIPSSQTLNCGISVEPNPLVTSSGIVIPGIFDGLQDPILEITDSRGIIVLRQSLIKGKDSLSCTVQKGNLLPGLYFFHVPGGGSGTEGKLLIE